MEGKKTCLIDMLMIGVLMVVALYSLKKKCMV